MIGCTLVENNNNTIKENETITLTFSGLAYDWSYVVTGANYTASQEWDILKITISNPTKDVSVYVFNEDCCFVAGTKVLMADGTTKNIEDVKVGDNVLSYNESTNEYENNVVLKLITNLNTTNLARVNLSDGTSIEMNEYHPIYTVEGWKSITNFKGYPTLTENDKILSINGEYIEILSIERWIEEIPITTYNLSIANNHNYFVGKAPILVHNAGCK